VKLLKYNGDWVLMNFNETKETKYLNSTYKNSYKFRVYLSMCEKCFVTELLFDMTCKYIIGKLKCKTNIWMLVSNYSEYFI